MSDISPSSGSSRYNTSTWVSTISIVCCLVLIVWLKTIGIVLSLCIAAAVYGMLRLRVDTPENACLNHSIMLSAIDITDVIAEFEHFQNSNDSDAMADRVLHRPELNNPDSTDLDIEAFYFQLSTARRFLTRLQAHLATANTTEELESLLSITDRRALELKEAWHAARRAAYRFDKD